jgi:hypothetical protein
MPKTTGATERKKAVKLTAPQMTTGAARYAGSQQTMTELWALRATMMTTKSLQY